MSTSPENSPFERCSETNLWYGGLSGPNLGRPDVLLHLERFMKQRLTTAFLLAGLIGAANLHAASRPIRVLAIAGYSNHDWRHTTECLLALLIESERCEVTVSTAPRNGSPDYTSWRPRFSDFDVVVQICNSLGSGNAWPAPVRQDFEDYVRAGGGVFVLHGANNSFPEWPAYNAMIGMGWRRPDQGDALEIVDGKVVRIPAGQGNKTNHGPRRELVVQRLVNHPITRGYPQRWKTTDVELYRFARGPAKQVTVLSYGKDKDSGRQWPMEWVVVYGNGRIYNGTFGHVWKDLRTPPAVQCVGWQTTLIRAIRWLAGREVDYPIPASFPTEEKVSLRTFNPVYRGSEGWRSLFNGNNLTGWHIECPPDERDRDYWRVVDGAIECNSVNDGKHEYSWLMSDREFADFQVRLRFQVFQAHQGNSGVQFRSRYDTSGEVADGPWLHGPQVDIHAPVPLRVGLIYDETWETRRWIHPSLPNSGMVPEKAPEAAHATRLVYADDDSSLWNDLEIVAEGTSVKTFVNGRLVTDFDGAGILDDADHRRHQVGMSGHLGLQLHRNDKTRIRFKKIWIREL